MVVVVIGFFKRRLKSWQIRNRRVEISHDVLGSAWLRLKFSENNSYEIVRSRCILGVLGPARPTIQDDTCDGVAVGCLNTIKGHPARGVQFFEFGRSRFDVEKAVGCASDRSDSTCAVPALSVSAREFGFLLESVP